MNATPKPARARVAIVGFGTVGRSVGRLLMMHRDIIELTRIFNRDISRKKVDWVPADVRWTSDIDDVFDKDVDVVVELVGGLDPAGDWIRRALGAGKSVVTANKKLIARDGPELMELARKNSVRIGFEASVAGGIPIVAGLQQGLAGDRLLKVSGILNGTCNYILSSMDGTGRSFATVLAEAQAKGYAEADPTDDVDGYDARAKLAILSWVGLQHRVQAEAIECRSISSIEPIDFTYAQKLGYTIRQVARAELVPEQPSALFASVQPALVPLASPLARVLSNQNLVLATGEFGGETVFSGNGAGGDPTAVAVVSDIISIAHKSKPFEVDRLASATPTDRVVSEFRAPHYIRLTVMDRPGIIASVATILANHDINIDAVFQEHAPSKSQLPFVMTLEASSTRVAHTALREIQALDFHVQPPVMLPFLDPRAD